MRDAIGPQNSLCQSVAFEILNFPFMLFGRSSRGKRAQIPPFAGLGGNLPGVKTIFTGFELSDHCGSFVGDARLST
jgi:hypothetical protein